MTKQLRIILAIALALIMGFAGATFAFADEGETQAYSVELIKTLNMDAEEDIPEVTFDFNVAGAPAIGNVSISFSDADDYGVEGDVKSVVKSAVVSFADIEWPEAGIYAYTVTEINGGDDDFVYSDAVYAIEVYVNYVEVDLGEEEEPGEELAIVGLTVSAGGSKVTAMNFVNEYAPEDDGGPGDPVPPNPLTDAVLSISNSIAGVFGNRSMFFPFNVLIDSDDDDATFRAYVVENGAVVTAAANFGGGLGTDVHGDFILFSAGTDLTVNLKHGQALVFADLEDGDEYTVIAGANANYILSVAGVADGVAWDDANENAGEALSTGLLAIGEDENSVAFTYTHVDIPPTGLTVQNAPYIGMILFAVLGAGAAVYFAVTKTRRKAQSF